MAEPDPPTRSVAECAEVLRAMGNEARLSILRTLVDGPLCVSDLCAALDLEQSFTSRHLGILRNAGLVLARRDAQRVIYALHPDVRRDLQSPDPAIDLGCCQLRFPAEHTLDP